MSRFAYKPPRIMPARFASTCPETGKPIRKGDEIAYFPDERKAYHAESGKAQRLRDDIRAREATAALGLADADW
ncbi:hypothetical protein [Geminisphaera colitermitum]|uniref:hypothetical protein n=1 Tax=Geminisphaera colitermitum TaxID=1148786 RepID=UPI00019655E8|nr:hypothetical protein [Geminisphaera colitermitum]